MISVASKLAPAGAGAFQNSVVDLPFSMAAGPEALSAEFIKFRILMLMS
jgi:hypothetical protein